ncbi:MAG: polysaccharide deacetylase family protein [Endomicrobiales bacterium]
MKKTSCIITVDTETFSRNGVVAPCESTIYGYCNGEKFGIERLMEICERRGYQATFFVDVPEHYLFGKDTMAEICRLISSRRHDVQLHIHANCFPGHLPDFMHRYPYGEQREMIRESKALIEQWTGAAPIAFRAGAYAANLDTIRALAANGFKVDSSYFYFHRYCELSRQLDNRFKNNVFTIGPVLEIPVTIYKMVDWYIYREYSKIDINACTAEELCHVIGKMSGHSEVLIFFLHSFSFLRLNDRSRSFVPALDTLHKFDAVLDFISRQEQIEVVTMSEYYRRALAARWEQPGAEHLATSGFGKTFKRVAGRYVQQYTGLRL